MQNLPQLQRPLRERRRGLSPRFYFVALIAVVLMIGLQALPLLHGRASAEEDAAATPPETQATQPETQPTTQPTGPADQSAAPKADAAQPQTSAASSTHPPEQSAPQSAIQDAAPAATTEPQAAAITPLAPAVLTIDAPMTTTPEPPAAPADERVAAEPTKSAESAAATTTPQDAAPATAVETASPTESAEFTESTDVALASSTPAATPRLPLPDESALAEAAPQSTAPNPDMWRGVLRILSALTRVDLTSPSATSHDATDEESAPKAPFVDASAPTPIPDDGEENQAEVWPTETEQSPFSAIESLPAPQQPLGRSDQPQVVIENPPDSGGLVRYLVDGEVETLRPGERQMLRPGESKIIFHRGGDFGNSAEVVREGTYQFRVTQDGWTLTR